MVDSRGSAPESPGGQRHDNELRRVVAEESEDTVVTEALATEASTDGIDRCQQTSVGVTLSCHDASLQV